ncbi:MAG: septum formation initiator family protein [Flavobacteriaceae bacterium]|nr:septum formation initiator family protein [Flavobacteriaceae bacterium]PKP44660.1 MAG: septum formation initiator [Bacteroidetes bacterium HGW-Bacteroidetes-13]
MSIKELFGNKYFRFFTNRYLVVGVFFVVWMIFLDANSYFIHRELSKEIDKLDEKKLFFSKEIEQDKKAIQEFKDSEKLEEYARDKFFMKRENEDIFIIENDTLTHE